MKTIAMVMLLIYQIGIFIMAVKSKQPYEKELRDKLNFIIWLIPIALCIILAM